MYRVREGASLLGIKDIQSKFHALKLSVHIPEHSGPSSRLLECVSIGEPKLLNSLKEERKGAPYG